MIIKKSDRLAYNIVLEFDKFYEETGQIPDAFSIKTDVPVDIKEVRCTPRANLLILGGSYKPPKIGIVRRCLYLSRKFYPVRFPGLDVDRTLYRTLKFCVL